MKPALFVAFLILSAGVLTYHLLHAHRAFKPPAQLALAELPAETPDVKLSVALSAAQARPDDLPVAIPSSLTAEEPGQGANSVSVTAAPAVDSDPDQFPVFQVMPLPAPTDTASVLPASTDTVAQSPLTESAVSTPETTSVAELPAIVKKGKKRAKILVKNDQLAAEERTQPAIKSPLLSESSKQYLDRMNKLLDEELGN